VAVQMCAQKSINKVSPRRAGVDRRYFEGEDCVWFDTLRMDEEDNLTACIDLKILHTLWFQSCRASVSNGKPATVPRHCVDGACYRATDDTRQQEDTRLGSVARQPAAGKPTNGCEFGSRMLLPCLIHVTLIPDRQLYCN